MPKNRPLLNEVVARNEDNYRKILELEFWRCEYTKRKYILDFKDRQSIQECIFVKSLFGVDLVDKAIRFVSYHADVALGIVNDVSVPRDDMYKYLEQVIIAYHNFAYQNNPKYRIIDFFGVGFDIQELYDCLGFREYESISVLHADAQNYGFYPMDLIKIRPVDELVSFIEDYLDRNAEFPFLQNSFPMVKKQNIDFNYKDKDGARYFAEESLEDAVYVYIDCLDGKETIERIYKRIIGLINKAKKNRKMLTAGDRENSDIQICIYDKSLIQDKDKLKEILINNVLAYRNWHSPEFMFTESTIQMAKYLIVPEYEQVPFNIRAAGLYLWDKVHFFGEKLSSAIVQARNETILKLNRDMDDKSLDRCYRLAKNSVEKMSVLKFSEL